MKNQHEEDDFYPILGQLLKSLKFDGDERVIFEAVPHLVSRLGIEDLRALMANLGYASQMKKFAFKKIPSAPGIFRTRKNLFLILKSDTETVHVLDLITHEEKMLSRHENIKGEFCYFFIDKRPVGMRQKWIQEVAGRFKSQITHLFFIGIFNAIFALTLPFFIRFVFDWAIPTKSEQTLHYLLLGLALALICHHMIHGFQNRSLAFVGARLNMIISLSVIKKILSMQYAHVENAPVQSQITRIRQFDGLKEFFTSPLAQLFLDGPFVIFFTIVLGILGGPLVVIPIILLALFTVMGFLLFPMIRGATRLSSFTGNEKFSFMLESFGKINTLKYLGGEKAFSERFEERIYNHSKAAENSEILSSYASNLSQILIKIAGVITILWGATRVMDGLMTVGSLVAVVLLIWRALSPFQSVFMFLSQIDLTFSTIEQINQLMAAPIENYAKPSLRRPTLNGNILCENISFRYPSGSSLALHNVTLEAKKGEIVAIMGENASGKSTLLKLLLGFYQPIHGTIYLDHFDLKQLPVNHLRQSIAFVPQYVQFFHGTIAQNLLLAHPHASREQLIEACKTAFVWDEICRLPHGLDEKLTDRSVTFLNAGFQQKLCLARAYLRDSSVLLFDEPGSNLDLQGDEWFKKTLQMWRGQKTMLIVTHRPSVIDLSDRVLVLSHGKMRYFGPTQKVLELMKTEGAA